MVALYGLNTPQAHGFQRGRILKMPKSASISSPKSACRIPHHDGYCVLHSAGCARQIACRLRAKTTPLTTSAQSLKRTSGETRLRHHSFPTAPRPCKETTVLQWTARKLRAKAARRHQAQAVTAGSRKDRGYGNHRRGTDHRVTFHLLIQKPHFSAPVILKTGVVTAVDAMCPCHP